MCEIENGTCNECGMPVKLGEYHPYAACLMYKACQNAEVVRSNLKALTKTWFDMGCRETVAEIERVTGQRFEFAPNLEEVGRLIDTIRTTNTENTRH